MDATPADVLAFWFGAPPWRERAEWFRKSDAFDAAVRSRFRDAIDAAQAGALPPAWHAEPLAEVLLLDQLARNAHRGTARAFAGDARALALAREIVDSGADRALHPLQRWFAYMPLEHAEDLAAQDHAVRLFEALAAAGPGFDEALDYARRHRDVIRRFGRFPHRNAVLGRASTPDEIAFLRQPGSSF